MTQLLSLSRDTSLAQLLKASAAWMPVRFEDMETFIGKRVEIPVHYNLWMCGARFGTVTGRRRGSNGHSAYLTVKMDHPQVRRCVKLWALDVEYARVID